MQTWHLVHMIKILQLFALFCQFMYMYLISSVDFFISLGMYFFTGNVFFWVLALGGHSLWSLHLNVKNLRSEFLSLP